MRVKNIQIEVEDDETTLGIIILTLQDKIKTLEEKTERLESSLNEILEYLAKERGSMYGHIREYHPDEEDYLLTYQ